MGDEHAILIPTPILDPEQSLIKSTHRTTRTKSAIFSSIQRLISVQQGHMHNLKRQDEKKKDKLTFFTIETPIACVRRRAENQAERAENPPGGHWTAEE